MTNNLQNILAEQYVSNLVQIAAVVTALGIALWNASTFKNLEVSRTRPRVVLEIVFEPVVKLRTSNLGLSTAHDIRVVWTEGRELLPIGDSINAVNTKHLNNEPFTLVPSQSIYAYIGSTREVYDSERDENSYSFEITYTDESGKKRYHENFRYDLSAMAGVAVITEPLDEIATLLKKQNEIISQQRRL